MTAWSDVSNLLQLSQDQFRMQAIRNRLEGAAVDMNSKIGDQTEIIAGRLIT